MQILETIKLMAAMAMTRLVVETGMMGSLVEMAMIMLKAIWEKIVLQAKRAKIPCTAAGRMM